MAARCVRLACVCGDGGWGGWGGRSVQDLPFTAQPRRTRTAEAGRNPVWNETFELQVSKGQGHEFAVAVLVCPPPRSQEGLGDTRVGDDGVLVQVQGGDRHVAVLLFDADRTTKDDLVMPHARARGSS